MSKIKDIITEELKAAEARILSRIEPIISAIIVPPEVDSDSEITDVIGITPMPDNPNYQTTKELLGTGKSLPSIARILGVSLPTVKRYHSWLIRNGHVELKPEELTESEIKVASLIYDESKSLNETANVLECSVPNVTFLRNSALQKGYVPKYIIKILYPRFYKRISKPTIGFPANRESWANQISIGQLCFIYLTSPEKKIISLAEVTSSMRTVPGRWPFEFDVKFIIPPKHGVTLRDAGISFRPRPGDTYIPINKQEAERIINLLGSQPDLTPTELERLRDK